MSWVGVSSLKDTIGSLGSQNNDDTEMTDMDSNLHEVDLDRAEAPNKAVSIGEVGAPARFRHIKNNKYMRRLYIVLAVLAGIFVLSSLLRLTLKSNKKGNSNSNSSNGKNGMDLDLSDASIREKHLLIFLHDISVDESDLLDLANATSPQRMALQWIADEDPMTIEIPETRFDESYPTFLQRYSSAVLAFAWGPDNLAPMGFLSGDDVCEWNAPYKRPDASILQQGLICNDKRKVAKIVLQTVGLKGRIPRELGNFHSVSHLHLDGNKLIGHLPQTMRRLGALREFTATRNMLSGHLPPFLSHMKSLRHVELSKNYFSGHLAYAFDDIQDNDEKTSDLTASPLRVLALDNNKFNGPMDAIEALVMLEELYLNNNELTGHIGETYTDLDQLAILDVSKNKLSGKVPDYLLRLPSMTILDLHSNQFSGQHPHGNATSLKYLDLHANALVGVLPRSIGQHPNLAYLDLSQNLIEGVLPAEMGQLNSLQYLFLANNPSLEPGSIPKWILQLPVLASLSLQNTARTGAIPAWLGKMDQLNLLDLQFNSLNGTVPGAISSMTAMEYLFLNHNELQGQVPEPIGNLTDLILLNLDHNQLTGVVPDSLCQLADLDVLVADCAASDEGTDPLIECPCCSNCCEPGSETCNTRDWNKRYGEDWGGYYERYNIVEDGDVFELVDGDNEDDGSD